MSDPFYFFSYFISMCYGVRFMADNRSFVGVKVPDNLRYFLLILSFKWWKISIFAVLSQVYLYGMLVLFIMTKVLPESIISHITNDPNMLLNILTLIHAVMLFSIGMLESNICDWLFWKKH